MATDCVRRYFKPTNLFLIDGDLERVKIPDFGIARRQRGTPTDPARM